MEPNVFNQRIVQDSMELVTHVHYFKQSINHAKETIIQFNNVLNWFAQMHQIIIQLINNVINLNLDV